MLQIRKERKAKEVKLIRYFYRRYMALKFFHFFDYLSK